MGGVEIKTDKKGNHSLHFTNNKTGESYYQKTDYNPFPKEDDKAPAKGKAYNALLDFMGR